MKCYVEDRRKKVNIKPLVSVLVMVVFLSTVVISTEAHYEANKEQAIAITEEIGAKYHICPELLQAIIERESSYQPNVSSDYGCIGLMQIHPASHRERMGRLGVTDLTDPYQNVLVGTDYLSDLFQAYGDDLYRILWIYSHGNDRGYDENHPSAYAVKIVENSANLEREHNK